MDHAKAKQLEHREHLFSREIDSPHIGKAQQIGEAHARVGLELRCLFPAFGGASFMQEWKDALWDSFYTAAPVRQRQSVERYNIVKRA